MKAILWLAAASMLFAGCGVTAASARTVHGHRIVTMDRRPRKPAKVVIVVGSRVPRRPARSVVIRFDKRDYFYADGVYYRQVGREYEVIRPQIGMVVPALPRTAERIRLKEEELFLYDGILYKQIPTPNGLQYRVEGFMEYNPK